VCSRMIDIARYRSTGFLGLGLLKRMYGSVMPRAAVPSLVAALWTLLLKYEQLNSWISRDYFRLESSYGQSGT